MCTTKTNHVNQPHIINKECFLLKLSVNKKRSIWMLDLVHIDTLPMLFYFQSHKLHFDCNVVQSFVWFWLHSAWINATRTSTMNKIYVYCNGNGNHSVEWRKNQQKIHREIYREFARDLSRRKAILNKDWAFNHHIQFQTEYYCLLNYI